DRTETDNSTVFYFNIVIGIIVYAIVWMLAPYIANFYNMPLLDKVMKVTALTIPFYSLSIVQQAILTINIDFKSQAKISVISAFLSG
ncbi:lipopolysaccharide biosynthesis protein, partial [Pseudomonas donghuensis]|nr:lipopolysaccharide biosynthesis protein [Pseudomonas donghuensis]